MAPNSNSKPSPALFFFLVAVALAIPPLTSSRKFSPATALLDISAVLRRTHDVLSHHPQTTLNSTPPPFSSSSSFYIHIHPREALFKSLYSDYRSLVEARLSRDLARVESLASKHRHSLANLSAAHLRPEKKSVPVVPGKSPGMVGEYFGRIGIGSPAREFYLNIDTGSDVIWVQCEPCSECQKSDPVFDPSSSSTYRNLSCSSQQCRELEVSECLNGVQCIYGAKYGDGSYSIGYYATETMSFGNSRAQNGIALGCGHVSEGFNGTAGLVGLGGGAASLTSQLRAQSFSYCLVNSDSSSSSTLEFNSGGLGGGSVSAPLIRNKKKDYNSFYYLGLTGISVGGTKLSISPSIFQIDNATGNGGIIVDSGTTYTFLPTKAYDALRDAFVKKMPSEYHRTKGVSPFDTCYDFGSQTTSVRVPAVSFLLSGGSSWDLAPENYLIPTDSAGILCLAFAASPFPLGIIGNVQQQGTRVNFDLSCSNDFAVFTNVALFSNPCSTRILTASTPR